MELLLALVSLGWILAWLVRHRHARGPIWHALGLSWLALLGAAAALTAASLYLQKTLSMLIMPAGLIWVLLWLLCWHAWVRRLSPTRWLALGLLLLYSVAANQWVGGFLIRELESGIPEMPLEGEPAGGAPLEAICVLGGGTNLSPGKRAEGGQAADRVLLAARLFHRGRTLLLVASGSAIAQVGWPRDLAQETADIWRDLGVPEQAIRKLPEPKNTSQEVGACQALSRREGWQRVGLLTSAWHLPRVLCTARRLGFDVVPIPADHRGGLPPPSALYLIPNSEGFANVKLAVWEAMGMLVGR